MKKKTFDEDRDDVPCAIGKHHASVKASFPICMTLPNSAHSRMGCLHRKRKSPPLEEEKSLRQKNYLGPDSIYQEFKN